MKVIFCFFIFCFFNSNFYLLSQNSIVGKWQSTVKEEKDTMFFIFDSLNNVEIIIGKDTVGKTDKEDKFSITYRINYNNNPILIDFFNSNQKIPNLGIIEFINLNSFKFAFNSSYSNIRPKNFIDNEEDTCILNRVLH